MQDIKSKAEGLKARVKFAQILVRAREEGKRSDGQGAKRCLDLFEGNLAQTRKGCVAERASPHVA